MGSVALTAVLPVIELGELTSYENPTSYEVAGSLINDYYGLQSSLERGRLSAMLLSQFQKSLIHSRKAFTDLSARLNSARQTALRCVNRTISRTASTIGIPDDEMAKSLLTSLDSQMGTINAALETNREYNKAREGFLN